MTKVKYGHAQFAMALSECGPEGLEPADRRSEYRMPTRFNSGSSLYLRYRLHSGICSGQLQLQPVQPDRQPRQSVHARDVQWSGHRRRFSPVSPCEVLEQRTAGWGRGLQHMQRHTRRITQDSASHHCNT